MGLSAREHTAALLKIEAVHVVAFAVFILLLTTRTRGIAAIASGSETIPAKPP